MILRAKAMRFSPPFFFEEVALHGLHEEIAHGSPLGFMVPPHMATQVQGKLLAPVRLFQLAQDPTQAHQNPSS